ncbi:MAG: TlpA disulfide reductase family protein [Prevotellaceae bacterium]|nr:TlpA disulfide reductase family protein [Prevotellaceae bacterium]
MLVGVLTSASFVSCLSNDDSSGSGNNLTVGQTIPRFTTDVLLLDTADWRYSGTPSVTFNSEQLDGRLTVIAFFNTTCPDCQRELPVLQQFYDEIKTDTTLTFICIARAQAKDEVMSYWSQNKLSLPVSPQYDRTLYEKFASSGIPRVYFADGQGKITHTFSDKDTLSVEDLRNAANLGTKKEKN